MNDLIVRNQTPYNTTQKLTTFTGICSLGAFIVLISVYTINFNSDALSLEAIVIYSLAGSTIGSFFCLCIFRVKTNIEKRRQLNIENMDNTKILEKGITAAYPLEALSQFQDPIKNIIGQYIPKESSNFYSCFGLNGFTYREMRKPILLEDYGISEEEWISGYKALMILLPQMQKEVFKKSSKLSFDEQVMSWKSLDFRDKCKILNWLALKYFKAYNNEFIQSHRAGKPFTYRLGDNLCLSVVFTFLDIDKEHSYAFSEKICSQLLLDQIATGKVKLAPDLLQHFSHQDLYIKGTCVISLLKQSEKGILLLIQKKLIGLEEVLYEASYLGLAALIDRNHFPLELINKKSGTENRRTFLHVAVSAAAMQAKMRLGQSGRSVNYGNHRKMLSIESQISHNTRQQTLYGDYVATVTALLKKGARSNIQDSDGNTPEALAEKEGLREIANLLRNGPPSDL